MKTALLRRRRGGSAVARFAANGLRPDLVITPTLQAVNGVPGSAYTHSRASGATYLDSTGTLQTAAAGVPRVGHHVWNGSAWVNEGLLHESEARTNLLTYSEDFTDASWIKANTPLGAGVTAPDGTTNSTKLIPNTVNAEHYIQVNLTPATGTFTDSAFAKADELKLFVIRPVHVGADQGATQQAVFDLQAGVIVTNSANTTAAIQDFGNGWYRCSFTYPVSGTIIGAFAFRLQVYSNTNTNFFAGDNTSGLYVFGAQRETAPTPSSYIPTAGSTVTRAAETNSTDNATYDASAMWGVMKGTETYADLGTAGQVELLDWRDDVDNRITITLDTDGAETGEITLTMVNGGASASVAVDAMTPGINQALSLAWRVTGSEIAISCNGGAAVSAATAIGIPDLSAASIVLEGMGARALITQGTGDIGDTGIEEASA